MIPKSDTETLEDYGLYSNATITFLYQVTGGAQSHYSQRRTIGGDVKMTNKKCMLTLDDSEPTMELPCGHTISPHSLADYIKDQVKSRKTELKCPSCYKVWKLFQIKDMGLHDDEKRLMEIGLTRNLLFDKYNCKECPQCGCIIEKIGEGIRVKCYMCCNYEFCWNCLRKWIKPGNSCKDCGNRGCDPENSELIQLLLTCSTTTIDYCNVIAPTIRACPECGEGIGYTKGRCKLMQCPQCSTQFCFICLRNCDKKTGRWAPECGGYGTACKVAPRQTSLDQYKRTC